MKSILDNDTVDVPCPHCGKKLTQRVAKLKTNPHLTCRHCGQGFDVDPKQFKATLEKVDKAVADLQRKIGRTFK